MWDGTTPLAGRRTRGEAARLIAVIPATRRAVDARYAPPGVPPLAREVLGGSPSWMIRWVDIPAEVRGCGCGDGVTVRGCPP